MIYWGAYDLVGFFEEIVVCGGAGTRVEGAMCFVGFEVGIEDWCDVRHAYGAWRDEG